VVSQEMTDEEFREKKTSEKTGAFFAEKIRFFLPKNLFWAILGSLSPKHSAW